MISTSLIFLENVCRILAYSLAPLPAKNYDARLAGICLIALCIGLFSFGNLFSIFGNKGNK